MATIYNTELLKELRDGIKGQQLTGSFPNKLASAVVPVMEVNPKLLRRTTIIREKLVTNTAEATIYTTPTNQDFYLTGISMAYIKDATSQSTYQRVLVVTNGATSNIAYLPQITLTAGQANHFISFDKPVKIDRNTNISGGVGNATANISSAIIIYGYIDEQSLA